MPSQHLRGVGKWDLHWMKGLRKGSEDFREERWSSRVRNSRIPAEMPSRLLRVVRWWDLHWMKGPRKGSKDFRGKMILKNSKCLNSSYNSMSVSRSRRKKVHVRDYAMPHTGTRERGPRGAAAWWKRRQVFGTARRSRVMEGLGYITINQYEHNELGTVRRSRVMIEPGNITINNLKGMTGTARRSRVMKESDRFLNSNWMNSQLIHRSTGDCATKSRNNRAR